MAYNESKEIVPGWSVDESKIIDSFDFEKTYLTNVVYIISNHGWYVCYYVGLVYVATIFGLQRWMRKRAAYNLKYPLFIWNSCLGLFSIIGLFRTLPLVLNVILKENGLYTSICVKYKTSHAVFFWGCLFGISKYVELGDTIFIVLRKRPLVFLQWYHHLMTLIGTSTMGAYFEPIVNYGVVVNYAVHSIMYPYFAAKTVGLRVPSAIAKLITTLQFVQMLVFLWLNLATFYLKYTGVECFRTTESIIAASVVILSFSIIFGKLFYDSVIMSKKHMKLN